MPVDRTDILQTGQRAAAAAMCCETLEAQKRALSPEHPDTLFSAGSLASALNAQGQHAVTAAMLREALEVQKRVLGQEHPDTLRAAQMLALALNSQA